MPRRTPPIVSAADARPAAVPTPPRKRPFDFDEGLGRIRETLRAAGHADAAMFDLHARGHTSVFEQLVACVISIRTRDEVMLPVALRLFERAPDAAAMAALDEREIDALIRPATFHEGKARTIRAIARRTAEECGARCRATSSC